MLQLIFVTLSHLSHRTLIALGRGFGTLWFYTVRIRRGLAEKQMAQCFPEWSPERVHATTKEALKQLGTTFAEAGVIGRLAREGKNGAMKGRWPSFFSQEGFEHVEAAMAKGKGTIIVTGHLGNWDLFGYIFALYGLKLSIVARDIKNKALNKLWVGVRESSGLKQISAHRRQGAMKALFQTIKDNGVVALILDQNMSRDKGIFVDFFGRPACTLALPALLAKRTGATVLAAFMVRKPGGRHHVIIRPALPFLEAADGKDDITVNTQQYTRIIEDMVREYPEQWLWVHRRWKTQPVAEPVAAQQPVAVS